MTMMANRSQGAVVADWIEAYLVHADGDRYGRPFRLHGFQRDFLGRLYRTDRHGKRIVKRALLGLPKGNGKTELAAAIAIAELGGPFAPASPNVIVAAASFEQADILFGAARTMITEGKLAPYFEVFDSEIMRRDARPGVMRRVAAAAGTNDGHRPTFVVADELHEWVGGKERVHLVLTNGLTKRSDGLEVSITTAGADKDTLLGRLFDYGQRVNAGEIDDPGFLFAWRSASPDHDLSKPEQLRAAIFEANPAVEAGFLDGERLAARFSEIPRWEFERYHLNRFVESNERWLPPGAWAACEDKGLDLDTSLPVTVGVDLGLNYDNTAVVIAQRQGERIVMRAQIWSNPYRPGDRRADEWTFDLATVESHLRELLKRFPAPQATKPDSRIPAPGPLFVCDPYQLRRSIEVLEGDGLNIAAVLQVDSTMVPSSQALYDAIIAKRIAHDGDERFGAHIAAAIARQRPRGGWKLDKPVKSGRPIDAAEAAAMALHNMPAEAPKPFVRKPRICVGF